MPEIKVMVEGGKASPAAPLGPALGPLGVNIMSVVEKINAQTKSFAGMKVPVTIQIDSKKNVEIEVGSPPVSAIIKKELKIETASANAKATSVGNLTIAQVKKIAEMKHDKMNSHSMARAMKEVIGTCDSMGVWVEGKRAKDTLQDIQAGKFKEEFGEN